MPNLVVLGGSSLLFISIAMVLWDIHVTILSGVWDPATVGDWLYYANIHFHNHTVNFLYATPASFAFLFTALVICILGSSSGR